MRRSTRRNRYLEWDTRPNNKPPGRSATSCIPCDPHGVCGGRICPPLAAYLAQVYTVLPAVSIAFGLEWPDHFALIPQLAIRAWVQAVIGQDRMLLLPSGGIQQHTCHQIPMAQYAPYEDDLAGIGKDPIYLAWCLEHPGQQTLTCAHFRMFPKVVGSTLSSQDHIQVIVIQGHDLFDELFPNLSDNQGLRDAFQGNSPNGWPAIICRVGYTRSRHGESIATVGGPCQRDPYGPDGDGQVTVADIMRVAAAWGNACQ